MSSVLKVQEPNSSTHDSYQNTISNTVQTQPKHTTKHTPTQNTECCPIPNTVSNTVSYTSPRIKHSTVSVGKLTRPLYLHSACKRPGRDQKTRPLEFTIACLSAAKEVCSASFRLVNSTSGVQMTPASLSAACQCTKLRVSAQSCVSCTKLRVSAQSCVSCTMLRISARYISCQCRMLRVSS